MALSQVRRRDRDRAASPLAPAAAGLARRSTRNLAIVFYKDAYTISNQFYSFVVQGIVRETTRRDYNLLFSFVDQTYRSYSDLPKVVREKNAEGVIFLRLVSPKMIAEVQKIGVRVLTIDEYPSITTANSLEIDGESGCRLATEHLLRLGHERVVFMQGAKDRPSIQRRLLGVRRALEDAGLSKQDVDGYFCAGDAPGLGPLSMIDYMGLKNVRHMDTTETGGSSYIAHVGHAAQAIAAGKCQVALITLAGRPRNGGGRPGGGGGGRPQTGLSDGAPEAGFESIYGGSTHNTYGMCAMRHMHEYGTTSEQLAWIKVAASHHAQEGQGLQRIAGAGMLAVERIGIGRFALHREDDVVGDVERRGDVVTDPDQPDQPALQIPQRHLRDERPLHVILREIRIFLIENGWAAREHLPGAVDEKEPIEGEDGLFEGLHHLAAAEEAQVAARGGRSVLAVAARQLGEVGAGLDAVQYGRRPLPDRVLLGFGGVLRQEQDVAGAHLLGAVGGFVQNPMERFYAFVRSQPLLMILGIVAIWQVLEILYLPVLRQVHSWL